MVMWLVEDGAIIVPSCPTAGFHMPEWLAGITGDLFTISDQSVDPVGASADRDEKWPSCTTCRYCAGSGTVIDAVLVMVGMVAEAETAEVEDTGATVLIFELC